MVYFGIQPFWSGHQRIPYPSERPKKLGFQYIFLGKGDENTPTKFGVYTRYATSATMLLAGYDIAFLSRPRSIAYGCQRILVYALPIYGAGFAYLAGTHIAATLRSKKKSDAINHFFGGVLAGCVMGGIYRSIAAGIPWGFFIALAGHEYKFYLDKGIDLVEDIPETRIWGGMNAHRHDYTMVKERPANWYRDDPSEIQNRVDGVYKR